MKFIKVKLGTEKKHGGKTIWPQMYDFLKDTYYCNGFYVKYDNVDDEKQSDKCVLYAVVEENKKQIFKDKMQELNLESGGDDESTTG